MVPANGLERQRFSKKPAAIDSKRYTVVSIVNDSPEVLKLWKPQNHDKDNFRGAIVQLPSREDVTLPIREQLIIELYSK